MSSNIRIRFDNVRDGGTQKTFIRKGYIPVESKAPLIRVQTMDDLAVQAKRRVKGAQPHVVNYRRPIPERASYASA